ncbi:AAA family ATPase [Chloroflexota bacterium]
MIPIKLAVHNFMCYRDVPPLHFDGIHTASICGDNGNGKSALIDAMTWALWGKARSKSDDDLINQGQAEMGVEFDFLVSQQTYRVIRKRARPKRQRASGQSSLEFQIATNGSFKPITGNSISETERKIKDILHMDYDTFVNSAFLRQGHADEFTVASPARRKQVLADVLELSLYDELEEKARGRAKQKESEEAQLESSIKDIADELAQKPAYEAELEEAQNKLSQIEKVIREQESRLNELRQKKESLENKRTQLAQLEEHTAETARALEQWDDQSRQHRSRIKEYEEVLSHRSTIEEGYARFIEARQLCEELDNKFRQSVNLERQKTQLDNKIREASQSLLTDHALAQNKIGELEATAQKLPQLKNSLQTVQAELYQLAGEEEKLSQKKQTSQELQARVHILESGKAQLEQEITEVEEKLSLLLTESGAKCPLCETELGADSLKLIEAKYTADKQQKAESLKSSQSELNQKKTELGSLEGEISRLEARLKQDKSLAQNKASLLSQEIGEAEKAISQLNEEKSRLAEIEERLARKDFATSEQEALRQLEGELDKINYDPQQHEQARHRLTSLEQYESPKRKLEEADRLINQEKNALSRAEQAAQELRRILETDSQKRQTLTTELGALPQLTSDLARTEIEYQTTSAQQRQAQETVGSVKGKLVRCSELETKKAEKGKLLSQTSKEEKIYRDLIQAFGKNGIQLLIIETAIPEIEAEANTLLSRMTDNRMHVKIETQRETKKGDLLETLDIKISDELGTRNYEMFSGGEAFRVNFAIRIALSKVLARRAGAPLPTLIIDEGFGTQDSAGIEKLKEAINSIQDDFQKILVITHIEDFRDAFPTRIDVTKTPEGSTIEVS